MIKNYITTALRNIKNHQLFAFINIFGLATGLCLFSLIFIFVSEELSYDSFVPDSERIYRLEGAMQFPGRLPMYSSTISYPVTEALKENFPADIEDVTRLRRLSTTVQMESENIDEIVNYVDANFLRFFELEMIRGDGNALQDLSSIVITENTAIKYFGTIDAINRTMTIGANEEYRVTGILKNIPRASHFDIDMIALYDPSRWPDQTFLTSWQGWAFYNYVKFVETAPPLWTDAEIDRLLDTNIEIGFSGYEGTPAHEIFDYWFTALEDIHLSSHPLGAMKPRGNAVTVYIFTAVAILIIIIAVVNFINLSSARASLRAKEVALRKTMGATKPQLISQFLFESLLISLLALVIALVGVDLLLESFNRLMDINMMREQVWSGFTLVTLISITLSVGLIGGFYPALVLSGFKPARVLHSAMTSTNAGASFRHLLVIFQFAIAIALMIATMIVMAQTEYSRTMDLGFQKDRMLILNGIGSGLEPSLRETIRNEMLEFPEVLQATYSSATPFEQSEFHTIISLPNDPEGEPLIINGFAVDEHFINTYQIPLLSGRDFDGNLTSERFVMPEDRSGEWDIEAAVLINQSTVGLLGFGTVQEALGKRMTMAWGRTGRLHLTVIGVVPDIYFESVHHEKAPSLYFWAAQSLNDLSLSVSTDDYQSLMANIETRVRAISESARYNPDFLSDRISASYSSEDKRGLMFGVFASLAILIACLGLYGLATFTAEKKAREIGIRKVMGASTGQIVKLLLMQFSKPILVANIIAWPIAWYSMSDWLELFAYRIEIDILFFFGATIVALAIAWATIGGHAFKISQGSPILALRRE